MLAAREPNVTFIALCFEFLSRLGWNLAQDVLTKRVDQDGPRFLDHLNQHLSILEMLWATRKPLDIHLTGRGYR